MSEHLRKAIEDLERKLQEQLDEVAETKKAINVLSRQLGEAARFNDVSAEKIAGLTSIRPDQFFNKPLATVVREYLKLRGSAATVDEIYGALSRGGFEFVGNNEMIRKRGLQISLTKNRRIFAYVKASDSFGLWDFYGGRPKEEAEEEDRDEKEDPENKRSKTKQGTEKAE